MTTQTHEAEAVVGAPLRLNLGSGDRAIDGYKSVDRIYGEEVYPLAYADNSVDEILASHVLEHFSHREREAVVREWVRVLKPGGRIRIAVPDLRWWAENYLKGDPLALEMFLYGAQVDENDYHKAGFDEAGLRKLLWRCGLLGLQKWTGIPGTCSQFPISLNIEGFKPTEEMVRAPFTGRTAVVLTRPRLGFMDTQDCLHQVCRHFGFSYTTTTGAFVDQGFQRALENGLASGADYLLVVDYDSVFDNSHIERLFLLADAYPDFDAIAPMQMKRGSKCPLFYVDGREMNYGDIEEPVVQVDTAHFGCTLIRTAALRDLPKPWFLNVPNDDGEWGDGRVDADIYFWHKFRDAGKKLGIATHLSIGHLELKVTWPDEALQPIFQDIDEWKTGGAPENVRR